MQKFALTAEISTKVAGGATFFVVTRYMLSYPCLEWVLKANRWLYCIKCRIINSVTTGIGSCRTSHARSVLLRSNDAGWQLPLAFQRRRQLVETQWYVTFEWRRVGQPCETSERTLTLQHVGRRMRSLDRVWILNFPHRNWLWQTQNVTTTAITEINNSYLFLPPMVPWSVFTGTTIVATLTSVVSQNQSKDQQFCCFSLYLPYPDQRTEITEWVNLQARCPHWSKTATTNK